MRHWEQNYITLSLSLRDACAASHSGACDGDVACLLREPYIRAQLDALALSDMQRELREYGAWDATELEDVEANHARLVWLAAGDIRAAAEERHPVLMGLL